MYKCNVRLLLMMVNGKRKYGGAWHKSTKWSVRPKRNKISLSIRSVWSFFAVRFITPGNVVRGNQKLCKENLYRCNRPWQTALEKCKQTGECSCSCIILTSLQQDVGKSNNVVLKSIHFCTKEINGWTWKDKRPIFNLIYPEQGVVE